MIKAVGPKISFPISPAVVAGNTFFATNVPVDLQSGHFVGGPIETQARQVFGNLEALLKEAGGSLRCRAAHHLSYRCQGCGGDEQGLCRVFRQGALPSRATVIVRELIGPPGSASRPPFRLICFPLNGGWQAPDRPKSVNSIGDAHHLNRPRRPRPLLLPQKHIRTVEADARPIWRKGSMPIVGPS